MPIVVGVIALVLGLAAGTAAAYFAISGIGTGDSSVGTLQPVVVEQATVTPGLLFPGGKAALSLTLMNPNHFAVTLVGVSEAGVGTTITVSPPTTPVTACTGANAGVSVSDSVASNLSYTVQAHTTQPTGVAILVITTGVVMSTTSASACQTKAFHVKVTVAVQSP